MKLTKLIAAAAFAFIANNALAAQNIDIYYSPTCPHCHHALEYIDSELKPEYKDLKVNEINVMDQSNRDAFIAVLKKCDYQSGGVPVMVVNGKCFQGYAEFMNKDIKAALGEPDVKQADQTAAATDSANALPPEQLPSASGNTNTATMLYILLGVLLVGLGFVVFGRKKKK